MKCTIAGKRLKEYSIFERILIACLFPFFALFISLIVIISIIPVTSALWIIFIIGILFPGIDNELG